VEATEKHQIKAGDEITVDDCYKATITKISMLPSGTVNRKDGTITHQYRVYYKFKDGSRGNKNVSIEEDSDIEFVVS